MTITSLRTCKPLDDHHLTEMKRSLHAKPLRVRDGQQQAVRQLFLGAVLGQQQLVEARVRGGQAVRVGAAARHNECELAAALDRNPITARTKLKQQLALFVSERVNNFPERANDARILVVALVDRDSLQVGPVYTGGAAHQHLQLLRTQQRQGKASAH
eukprot:CAMPEP_0177637378 /NCGR_PEP_ID=MMETSP0447-20121125/4940_1 /TAXON_ID=0 /ORGANISM="Stygamoeba regulata, Strain BSH-02190019" /LENGTH=157 /DNA_ID=CAMNT_0019139303 /DNA_START=72 /DNA_END=542 /DNA_ORIENTATION=+